MEFDLQLEDYRKLLNAMEAELRNIGRQLQKLQEPGEEQTFLKNRKFELKILCYTMQRHVQYEEEEDRIWMQLTKQNYDRLLGFLISRL